MNDLYQDLYYQSATNLDDDERNTWAWEKRYTLLIIQECLSQMSDHLDKQRVIKHFGLGE